MLYLLRHEERPDIPVFHTELTNNGKKNSINLAKILENIDIDMIFCSPFIRTLQTIKPYCKKNNLVVNCEMGLYEFLEDPRFEKDGIKTIHNIYDDTILRIINYTYRTIVLKSELKYPETEETLLQRTNKVLKYIKNLKKYNILIVSHLSTINALIKNIYFEHDINTEFKMGELIQIPFT